MDDTNFEAGRIRYVGINPTQEQRDAIKDSPLYALGDIVLIAVNVGDLDQSVGDWITPLGNNIMAAPYTKVKDLAAKPINLNSFLEPK